MRTSTSPAGQGLECVRDHAHGSTQILPAELGSVLAQCDNLRTVDGHIGALAALGWEDDGSGTIRRSVLELIERSLMLPQSVLVAHASLEAPRQEVPSITTIAWVTCDRAETLQRGVRSFVENHRAHGRSPRFIVMDDSRSAEERGKTRKALSSLCGELSIAVAYVGTDEKRHLLAALGEASRSEGIPPETLDFVLSSMPGHGRTVGANRNAALLATGGELTIMTDDDIVCRIAVSAPPAQGVEISAASDPTEIRPMRSRGDATAAANWVETDVMACHERLLGRRVRDILDSASSVVLDDISPALATRLAAGTLHVPTTTPGVVGDSGMAAPRYLLSLRKDERARIFGSEETRRKALECREIIRIARRDTLSDAASLMSHHIGLDNRVLLPPFFPVLRNSDGVFAATLRASMPDGLIGHVPFAVSHEPHEARSYPCDSYLRMTSRMSETLILLVNTCAPTIHGGDAAARMQSLGKRLAEIGALDRQDFEELLRVQWMRHLSRSIGHLESRLTSDVSAPELWAADMETHIASVRSFAAGELTVAPVDLLEGRTEEDALDLCRALTRKFGVLLSSWPIIVRAALRLRSQGSLPLAEIGASGG